MRSISISKPANSNCSCAGASGHDCFVQVDGVRVRYIEAGEKHVGPPLLIVHGYNGSCDYWYPATVMGLAAERHVIAVDLPGNGLSGKMSRHTLDTQSRFLAHLVRTLGCGPVDLMGHSMGGLVSIASVSAAPELFRSLLLVDSAGLPDLVRHPLLVPLRSMSDSSVRQWRLYPTFIKIGLRARTARESLHIVRTGNIAEQLAGLRLPVFILWGEKDQVVPVEHGYYMAEHIPGAIFKIVRGAGHMPFYDKPDECNRAILSFISGLEREWSGYCARKVGPS